MLFDLSLNACTLSGFLDAFVVTRHFIGDRIFIIKAGLLLQALDYLLFGMPALIFKQRQLM